MKKDTIIFALKATGLSLYVANEGLRLRRSLAELKQISPADADPED
jgi:hypothetical protein